MADPQTATLTLLFTDIEGSTRLLQELGDGYGAVLDRQRRLVEDAVRTQGGHVFGSEGDALFASFDRPSGAIMAAAHAQRSLAVEPWPDGHRVRVRMGVHTGVVSRLRDDYVGLPLHQAARITAAGHGGQVLVSAATAALVQDQLAELGLRLRDLGEHRLKDLPRPEPLAQLEGDGLGGGFPALRTIESRPGNLPVQLTSFVGRAEIASAAALLATTRLLTLVGPGGTGKTRLALQLATDVGSAYPDGTFFVGLDAVLDPELVAPAILAVLDVPDGAGPALDRLAEYLRDRRLLLVLDNLEQVVAAGPALARLLREAPELRIVATSRIPLRVSGEQEFAVPPLGVPSADTVVQDAGAALRFEAVRLFVERALAVSPGFVLDDGNAPAVVDIVRRLDGLPLAIELAAARVRVLPVDALRARLDRALGVLVGGARDLPARQQTLRGAIDWSYDLLEEPERRLFARFSVIAGAARLSEIEAICGPPHELGRDVLDGLTSLTDGSLLRAELAVDEEPRFAMLATIREYAAERLAERGDDERERMHRRHAETYLAVAEGCRSRLTGREGRRWLDRLEADHDNFRAAVDWAVAVGETALAVRLLDALWRFWQFRGHLLEATMRAQRILEMPGIDELPPELEVAGFRAAGSIAYWRADQVPAHAAYRRALDAARRSGQPGLEAEALYNLGFAALDGESVSEDRYVAGRPLFEEALARYRELGDDAGIAQATWALALAHGAGGDIDAAFAAATESLASQRRIGDPFGLGWALHLTGAMSVLRRSFDDAERDLREALAIFSDNGDVTGIALVVGDFALLARARGEEARMWRIVGALERARRETGLELLADPMASLEFEFPEDPPDEPSARAAYDAGLTLTLDEVATELVAPPAEAGG